MHKTFLPFGFHVWPACSVFLLDRHLSFTRYKIHSYGLPFPYYQFMIQRDACLEIYRVPDLYSLSLSRIHSDLPLSAIRAQSFGILRTDPVRLTIFYGKTKSLLQGLNFFFVLLLQYFFVFTDKCIEPCRLYHPTYKRFFFLARET